MNIAAPDEVLVPFGIEANRRGTPARGKPAVERRCGSR